jgi:6-phosphogluconolactonase (cycloisomerase 2 family)
MRILHRVLASLLMMLALLLLASCSGAPGCPQAGFGNSTACGPGGLGGFGNGGGGGGGGGGATPAAFVYAVDTQGGASGTGANGTIDGFDLSTSAGTFTTISNFTAPQIPAGSPGVGMVVARKQFVYLLIQNGAGTQGIYGWSINSSTGALTAISPVFLGLSLSIVNYNQYNMTTDPGGNFLYVADTQANEILVFTIDSTSGALTAGTPISLAVPPGCLTTDGQGKFLYVCVSNFQHGGSTQILAYSIGTGGVLTALTGSPFSFTPGMWQLQGDASGKYLIGTSGNTQNLTGADDKHLYVFNIQQTGATTGALSQVTSFATQFSPFNIAVQPPSSNGELVYSFSVNDTATGYNAIEGYQLNTTTGSLTALTNSPFSNGVPSSAWGQFDQSGSNLLVYTTNSTDSIDEIFSNGNLTQVTALSVSSSGNLTQPISPATLVTPGYWVVTDP